MPAPLLDLDLAKRIADGLVALLARWAPDAQPWPEDPAAREFAEALRKRDLREVLYLPDLEASPRWPERIWNADEPNHERVLIRVETERAQMAWAVAVFHGSLVHWEHLLSTVEGALTFRPIDPDSHWRLKLESPEGVLREKGLTLIPPAAMKLHFGRWRLEELLDPRRATIFEAARELEGIAGSLLTTQGIRSRPHAYQRLLDLLRFGHDPGTLVAVLENRRPSTYAELVSWISERSAPFSWTRDSAAE